MKAWLKRISKNKWLRQILRLLLSAAAIWMILRKVDVPTTLAYLGRVHPGYYALAFLTFFASRWSAAARINSLYRSQGLHIPYLLNLKLFFLSLFYNLFVPFVGGEGYKAIWLKNRYGTGYRSLVDSAFIDRLSGMLLLSVLCLLFLYLSSLEIGLHKSWAFAVAPILVLGHYLFMKWFFRSYLGAWSTITLHSLVIQSLQVATSFLILVALSADQQLVDYLFLFLLSSFAFVLPVIGAREGIFVYGSAEMGLDTELSFAVGLLFYLITSFHSLIGGVYLLFPHWMESSPSAEPS